MGGERNFGNNYVTIAALFASGSSALSDLSFLSLGVSSLLFLPVVNLCPISAILHHQGMARVE